MNEPTPGSDAAIEAGCTCPVLDNHHGCKADGNYWINSGCPLHTTKGNHDITIIKELEDADQ